MNMSYSLSSIYGFNLKSVFKYVYTLHSYLEGDTESWLLIYYSETSLIKK